MTEQTPAESDLPRERSASRGTTADELAVGDGRAGTSYDDPGGPGTAYLETVAGDPDADLGQRSDQAVGEAAEQPQADDGGSEAS